MLTAKDIRGGAIDYQSARHTSTEAFSTQLTAKSRPHIGDVLLTKDGSIGRVAVCDRADVCINQSVALLRPNSKILSRFLSYLLQAPVYQERMERDADGSTIKHIYITRVEKMPVSVPPLSQQQAIVEVLGVIDDKIAANTRLSEGASRLADSLFTQAIDAEDLTLSPLGTIATTVLGGTPSRNVTRYWTSGTVAWLNSGKANEERIHQPSEYITEQALEVSAAKLMPLGATVIAITGATLGQVARLEIEAAGNQSLVGIWSPDMCLNDWLYFAIRSRIPHLLTRATGAAQQHVNKRDVDALEVPVVDQRKMSQFVAKVGPLLAAAAVHDRQNITLAATRDSILPLLISGKLRVRDAEKTLEGVL